MDKLPNTLLTEIFLKVSNITLLKLLEIFPDYRSNDFMRGRYFRDFPNDAFSDLDGFEKEISKQDLTWFDLWLFNILISRDTINYLYKNLNDYYEQFNYNETATCLLDNIFDFYRYDLNLDKNILKLSTNSDTLSEFYWDDRYRHCNDDEDVLSSILTLIKRPGQTRESRSRGISFLLKLGLINKSKNLMNLREILILLSENK